MAQKFLKLTRPAIRALKGGEKITEGGITAERASDGDVRYSINVMVDGERIHRTVGTEGDGTTRTQAEELIEGIRTKAREGRLDLPSRHKVELRFAKAADLWLKEEKRVGGKDLTNKSQHIRDHLKPYLGTMRVDRITKFTAEKLRKHLRDKDITEGTVNLIFATYRRMGRRLQEWRYLKQPFPMIKLDRVDNRRTFVLTRAEEQALLEAAATDCSSYVWLFIKLGLGTSMRHSEILSARFENFDPVRRRLVVKVKGGKWRAQPLSRDLAETLERDRAMADDQNGWVFPSPASSSGHIESMKKAFSRCAIAAGLRVKTGTDAKGEPTYKPTVSPHVMRHTAVTRMARTGADIRTVQEFSGHQSLEMVMRYTHAQDEAVDDAIEKMERIGTASEQDKIVKLRKS